MIIWINGAFGAGKTSAAYELHRRLPESFVYDPENFGFFIRKNAPQSFSGGDFQDIELWREVNYKMLKMIYDEYRGTVIVPMTIVNVDYYDEIIGHLRNNGVQVRHFILYASKKVILKRLRSRISGLFGGETFAKNSIDSCIYSFDNLITEEKIFTDNMSVDEVVEEIANRCEIELPCDRKTKFGGLLYRIGVIVRHIR